jgi:methylglyoxal synthase
VSGDVDFQALTRLSIMHDTPIALSASAADMVVAASLVAQDS